MCEHLSIPCHAGPQLGSVTIADLVLEVHLVERISETHARGLVGTVPANVLLAAQRATEDARVMLRSDGIAFFDERGYLSIHRPGLHVEAADPSPTGLDPKAQRLSARPPLDGIGLDIAIFLLATEHSGGVRDIARAIGRTASSVSDSLRRLTTAGLITDRHEPVLPELFDAAAQAWRHRTVRQRVPGAPDDPRLTRLVNPKLNESTGRGWAYTGETAANAWEVPGITAGSRTTTVLVPNREEFDLALSLLRPRSAPLSQDDPFELIASPVAWLAEHRVDKDGSAIVPAIVVALDLAADPARGRDRLADWNPAGQHRVW